MVKDPQQKEMYIEKDQFAHGGFCVVQKARTREGKMFVIKKFRSDIFKLIK